MITIKNPTITWYSGFNFWKKITVTGLYPIRFREQRVHFPSLAAKSMLNIDLPLALVPTTLISLEKLKNTSLTLRDFTSPRSDKYTHKKVKVVLILKNKNKQFTFSSTRFIFIPLIIHLSFI